MGDRTFGLCSVLGLCVLLYAGRWDRLWGVRCRSGDWERLTGMILE